MHFFYVPLSTQCLFYIVKYSMKNMISIGLSFLFLFTIVHSHPHHGEDHSGPVVLNKSNEVDDIDSIIDECEKCSIKDKSKVENNFEDYDKSSKDSFGQQNVSFEKHSIPFSLNSRPPPISHL